MSDVKKLVTEISKRLNSNALSAASSASNISDVKFSDEEWGEITNQLNGLLTEEAALANPKIVESVKKSVFPSHKKTVLEQVENELKPFADKLGIDLSDAEFATEKIKKIASVIDTKLSSSNPDTEKLVNSLKADKEQLSKQLKAFETEYVPKAELEKLQQGFKAKDLQKAFALKFSQFDLADAYKDERIKKGLTSTVWSEIQEVARLDFDENDNIKVLQKDLDKELYINNKPVKFEDLIAEKLQPYIKKSDPPKPPSQRKPNTQEQPAANPNMNAYAAQKAKFLSMNK